MSLHVSSAPHVHSKDSTQTIMRDVLIAMLPTTVMGVYVFGLNAALLCVLGVAAAVLAEYGYQKMTRQRGRAGVGPSSAGASSAGAARCPVSTSSSRACTWVSSS